MGLPLAWADIIEAKGLVDVACDKARTPMRENEYVLTLPLCPTTNNLFMNRGKGRIRTKAYREWAERAAWFLKDVPAWPYGYPVAIDITIVSGKGWTLACDVANREKACVDSIVTAGILKGDSCRYVRRVSVGCEPGPDKKLPAVMRVEVREA